MIVPAYLPTRSPQYKNMVLHDGFQPGDHDIICGRGKQSCNHPGNRRFRLAIFMYMDRYQQASSKTDKSLVVISIVDNIRSSNGGFVKRNPKQQGQWIEIGDQLAREKVGHAIRDAISARKSEGRKREGGAFARMISMEQLMKLDARELEYTEKELKLRKHSKFHPLTRQYLKDTKTKSAMRNDNLSSYSSIATQITASKQSTTAERRLKNKCFPEYAQGFDEIEDLSPIQLDDLQKTDLSSLDTLVEQRTWYEPLASRSNQDREDVAVMRPENNEDQSFAEFIMDALSADEEDTPFLSLSYSSVTCETTLRHFLLGKYDEVISDPDLGGPLTQSDG